MPINEIGMYIKASGTFKSEIGAIKTIRILINVIGIFKSEIEALEYDWYAYKYDWNHQK